MDLEDAGCRARFLIRDRDGKFPKLFDAVLGDAGIEVVLGGVRIPRINSIMERWVQTCRRELLDRPPAAARPSSFAAYVMRTSMPDVPHANHVGGLPYVTYGSVGAGE
jgi:hypothetical protein